MLLKEDNCKVILQEVMEDNVIKIEDDKIILDEEGIAVAVLNIPKEMHRLQLEEEMKDFSPELVRRESRLFLLCLVSCVLLAVFFLILNISDYL